MEAKENEGRHALQSCPTLGTRIAFTITFRVTRGIDYRPSLKSGAFMTTARVQQYRTRLPAKTAYQANSALPCPEHPSPTRADAVVKPSQEAGEHAKRLCQRVKA
eukprot:3084791-Rhodomonas_salina.1